MKNLMLVLAVCCCGVCHSQVLEADVEEEIMDNMVEEFSSLEESGEDLIAHLQKLRSKPLNLNSASRKELASTMLLTDFQIESILDHLNRSGAILSFAELSLLYGFNEREVERIRPYFVLGPQSSLRQGFAKDQSTSVFARYQRGFDPQSEQHLVRSRFSYLDKVDASLVYKGKSSTVSSESFATGGAAVSGLKLGKVEIEHLVAGDFYARFGQGLSLWNGFSFPAVAEGSGFTRNAEPVSLYTSSDTSKLLRGVAASVSFGKLALSAGYSFRNSSSLARLSYLGRRTRYGLSFVSMGAENNVLAVDLFYGGKGFVLFGEGARSLKRQDDGKVAQGWAFLGGVSCDAGSFSFHLMGRLYQDSFSSPLGGAYSSISKIGNQKGVSLRITGPVYKKARFALGVDYTGYPEPRYHVKYPSLTVKSYIKITLDDSGFGTQARNQLWVKGQLKHDLQYSDPLKKAAVYSLKAGGLLCLGRHLSLQSRAEINMRISQEENSGGSSEENSGGSSWGSSEENSGAISDRAGGKAFSISLKGSFIRRMLSVSSGLIFYNVPDWDGRIYFPQSDLPYSFSSTLLYGRGTDVWALVKTRLSHRLSLYLKYQYNRGKNLLKGALSLEL